MKMFKLTDAYRRLKSFSPSFRERYPTFFKFLITVFFNRKIDFEIYYASTTAGPEVCAYSLVSRHRKCDEVTIEDLLVLQPFRLNGYGRDTVRTLLQIYETQSFIRMNIVINSNNIIALSMFINLGFLTDAAETSKLALQTNNNNDLPVVLYTLLR